MQQSTILSELRSQLELKSSGFLVTIYGDVVVPRGGSLSTSSLIDICQRAGFSETVVRTAISRLVQAQQLEGVKSGRRSFYRLHPSAAEEFHKASSLLYYAPAVFRGWQILHLPNAGDEEIKSLQAARLGPQVLIRPDRGQPFSPATLHFTASDNESTVNIASLWDLSELKARYGAMLLHFEPLRLALQSTPAMDSGDAFLLRLLLVHIFRAALLRDPLLPLSALGKDWPGEAARQLFNALYRALTPLAEVYIAHHLEGERGLLPKNTPQSDALLQSLAEF